MSDGSARLLADLVQSETFRIAIEEFAQDEISSRMSSMRGHIRSGMDRQVVALEAEISILEDLLGLFRRAGARVAPPTRV